MRRPAPLAACSLLACSVFAQSPPSPPSFDVASIRPAAPAKPQENMLGLGLGGPGTSDPGTFRIRSATLRDLLTRAYQVRSFPLSVVSWLDSARFDITAKVPAGATREQFNAFSLSSMSAA